MHNENSNKKLTYYAYLLIFFSIILLFCGLILNFNNSQKLIDPVRDVNKSGDESTISITTNDGSEVVPGNTIVNTNDDGNKSNDSNINTNSANNSSNNTNNTTINNPVDNKSNSNAINKSVDDLDYQNNELRNKIQDTYGITVKYGNETDGYVVGGVSTTSITDSKIINEQLLQLNNTLNLYPHGMFKEIRDGGIPLTIILINNYSQNSITGVTDSSYNYAYISIAAIYPFGESFFHESYHYIERYLFKNGANFNSWNMLNPNDFEYGNIYNEFSYSNTFLATSPFVNSYAQTSPAEDRASTFEYMMADSKASCLNKDNVVWQKATYMSRTIDIVLDTVSPDQVEYWERFL